MREVMIVSGLLLSGSGIFMLLYGHVSQSFIFFIVFTFGWIVAMLTKKKKVD